MRRGVTALVLLLALAVISPGQRPARKSTLAKTTNPGQKYKAIWEPVNVKEDLKLFSVHFVSADEGWVAGGKTSCMAASFCTLPMAARTGKFSWEILNRAIGLIPIYVLLGPSWDGQWKARGSAITSCCIPRTGRIGR